MLNLVGKNYLLVSNPESAATKIKSDNLRFNISFKLNLKQQKENIFNV